LNSNSYLLKKVILSQKYNHKYKKVIFKNMQTMEYIIVFQ